MSDEPLVAHSLAEAYLYLMVTPCSACDQGPLKGADARRISPSEGEAAVTVSSTCAACGGQADHTFRIAHDLKAENESTGAVVNPTDDPSGIIDVAQWITLFRMITEAAGREPDKVQMRHLGLEAAQCLDEALKFYDEVGNDLPPPEALFHDSSRSRFRSNPEQFSRQRLINLRGKLPTTEEMRARLRAPKKKRWWRRK